MYFDFRIPKARKYAIGNAIATAQTDEVVAIVTERKKRRRKSPPDSSSASRSRLLPAGMVMNGASRRKNEPPTIQPPKRAERRLPKTAPRTSTTNTIPITYIGRWSATELLPSSAISAPSPRKSRQSSVEKPASSPVSSAAASVFAKRSRPML